MSDVLTAVTAAVTGARMPTGGDVRRLTLTTGRVGGTNWEMTVADEVALTVRHGSVQWDSAMVAVRARVLHAIDTRPTLALAIEDAGNRLVLTDTADQARVAVEAAPADEPTVDEAAVDEALDEVWAHRQRELAAETDPTETALLAAAQADDADALGLLLDTLPSDDDVTLPALRGAAAAGLRHGLWMGWATTERLQALSGQHAAVALTDTLARADAGALRG